jgi:hypothetical protein
LIDNGELMTLFKERIRALDHAKDKDKLKWFMVEIELFGLAHLEGDENNHFIFTKVYGTFMQQKTME